MLLHSLRNEKLDVKNFFISLSASIALISGLWMFFLFLEFLGFPWPTVQKAKFIDLSFFTFSNFSFITFLTMVPIQNAETKLSPNFYFKIIHTPWTNFGLYALMISAVLSLFVGGSSTPFVEQHLGSLFMAIIATYFFSVLYHRFMTLQALYEPYIVYKNIDELLDEKNDKEIWLDVLEISYKAIKDNRLYEAKIFLNYLDIIFKKRENSFYQEDLKSLYKGAKDLRAITRDMESKWPFLEGSAT